MRKLINTALLVCASASATAANVQLDVTEANCKKVRAIAEGDPMNIATKLKVPLSSVRFLGAKWEVGRYAEDCVFTFDTAIGPIRCEIGLGALVSGDGGKTAWGILTPLGNFPPNPSCWQQ
jgi:hypothetical protein